MEQSWIIEIKAGNRQAFKSLYDEYFDYAMRVATAVTRHEGNAADAVQETFIRVYEHLDQYDINKPFKPWFYRILINECKRVMGQSARVVPVEHEWENDPNLAKRDNYALDQYRELYQAIQSLQEHHRIPIILKYLHDLTEKEIAQVLDLNLNTVKSRLFKARRKLKAALEGLKRRDLNDGP
ncbi:RNA polymerase sigma factor [Halalkalibacter urbisdiaboli]|uniref:RNA polymerase sigma factor n=1 Tax=Halalkalibacter urbisdiaboli TaxID=1960589 RepID=UPI000B435FE0|nr:RNA polymerase sigma factor [Halalkalibacter urbisdiaboli]